MINWNANFSRNNLETNNDLPYFLVTTIWVMWAMILWTNFCPVWLRSLWLNWNIPTVLKLERYDSVLYIPSEKIVQLFNNRSFVLMITENLNKIVAIATCSKNYLFYECMCSYCTFYLSFYLSFWNRIIGALNLWHMAELPLTTIWSTKQLKCSKSVWNLNAVPKNCFQFWVWVSWYYCIAF